MARLEAGRLWQQLRRVAGVLAEARQRRDGPDSLVAEHPELAVRDAIEERLLRRQEQERTPSAAASEAEAVQSTARSRTPGVRAAVTAGVGAEY